MASRRHEILLETKNKVSHMIKNLSLSTAVKIFSLRSLLNFPSDLAYYSAVLSLCWNVIKADALIHYSLHVGHHLSASVHKTVYSRVVTE